MERWSEHDGLLYEAAAKGDLVDVQRHHLAGGRADAQNQSEDGKQPIHVASTEGHLEVMRWLVLQDVCMYHRRPSTLLARSRSTTPPGKATFR